MKKRYLSLVMGVMMMLGITACQSNSDDVKIVSKIPNSAQESATEETTLAEEATEEAAVPQKRISSKQRRLSLDEYRDTYLRVPKIIDRKPIGFAS